MDPANQASGTIDTALSRAGCQTALSQRTGRVASDISGNQASLSAIHSGAAWASAIFFENGK